MTLATDRAEIVRRFETLLDSALANEDPPAGIDAEILQSVLNNTEPRDSVDACDSYNLWAAMTALIQEVKLQGRAFQELNRTLAAQPEKIADELRALYAERESALRRETERRCRRESLSALIDLRDRLGRGRESVRVREAEIAAANRAGWFSRTFSRRSAGAASAAAGALGAEAPDGGGVAGDLVFAHGALRWVRWSSLQDDYRLSGERR